MLNLIRKAATLTYSGIITYLLGHLALDIALNNWDDNWDNEEPPTPYLIHEEEHITDLI